MNDVRNSPVYAVAGGNHVTIVVDARETGGEFDLIEVLAQTGGGPPPHRHAFAEWFHVLEGKLQILEPTAGRLRPIGSLEAGQSYFVAPWAAHTTRNLGSGSVRFLVAGRPGTMTSYFAEAGVPVSDPDTMPDIPPLGPEALAALAARYDIQFVPVEDGQS
ncbi:MAG TPA: cupin domain-containing protein [Solirubrobacteraceae bacterium]|nr:cupin domain-containing protein [Solirubrobacteraceae bacterium]